MKKYALFILISIIGCGGCANADKSLSTQETITYTIDIAATDEESVYIHCNGKAIYEGILGSDHVTSWAGRAYYYSTSDTIEIAVEIFYNRYPLDGGEKVSKKETKTFKREDGTYFEIRSMSQQRKFTIAQSKKPFVYL